MSVPKTSGLVGDAKTHFASPERFDAEELRPQQQSLTNQAMVRTIMDASPEPSFILNEHRQIVMVNDKAAALLGRPEEDLVGLRPGEAFDCVHSDDMPAGCGTSEFCKYCGAAQAVVSTQNSGDPDVRECRLTRRDGDGEASLNLRVWTTCIEIDGRRYTVFSIRDTTDQKRRELLERIFFHDALNTSGALLGIADLMADADETEVKEFCGDLHDLSHQLVEEIQAQRDLAAAERGELATRTTVVKLRQFLGGVVSPYRHHHVAVDRRIVLQDEVSDEVIETDGVLLARVVGNLVKNALEASEKGQTVTVRLERQEEVIIQVHNESVMPEETRLQIFQRSFSTKGGPGRGLGTYSIKLLTERYLEGKVSFRSREGEGTTFTLRLPPSARRAHQRSAR